MKDLHNFKIFVLLMAATSLLSSTVAANAAERQIYRSNQPNVISPPPQPQVTTMRAATAQKKFAAAYAARSRPGIALFWNREMTDTLFQDISKITDESYSSRQNETQLTNTATDGIGDSSEQIEKDYSGKDIRVNSGQSNNQTSERPEKGYTGQETRHISEKSDKDKTNQETRHKVERTAKPSGPLSSTGAKIKPKIDLALRNIFMNSLLSANARIIDRTMMMRSSTIKFDSIDSQQVEMKGLQDNARYLVEVMVTPDKSSPLGCGFQIDIKDIQGNEHLAAFYTLATPPKQGPGKFMAVSGNGFERSQPKKPSVQDYGRQLGTEFLEKFAAVLISNMTEVK